MIFCQPDLGNQRLWLTLNTSASNAKAWHQNFSLHVQTQSTHKSHEKEVSGAKHLLLNLDYPPPLTASSAHGSSALLAQDSPRVTHMGQHHIMALIRKNMCRGKSPTIPFGRWPPHFRTSQDVENQSALAHESLVTLRPG